MASIHLYGKTLEIPKRNEALVKFLRELLEEAEDGHLVSLSYVGRHMDGAWSIKIIEDGELSFASLGAIDMLKTHYQSAIYADRFGQDEDEDDED